MKYLHKPLKAGRNCVILVNFDQPAKVMLLKDSDYNKYKDGKTYDYRGGFAENSPVKFVLPEGATWHVIVELGSYFSPSNVNATVQVLPAGTSVDAVSFNTTGAPPEKAIISKLESLLNEEDPS